METITLDPPSKSAPQVEIYQLHFLLLDISPAIWRRVWVRSDSYHRRFALPHSNDDGLDRLPSAPIRDKN